MLTTIVWVSNSVGDSTGSTHRGSGVANGQGILVGPGESVTVAVITGKDCKEVRYAEPAGNEESITAAKRAIVPNVARDKTSRRR